MTKVFIVTFLMAFTFLLICWVVTQYQIYTNEHFCSGQTIKIKRRKLYKRTKRLTASPAGKSLLCEAVSCFV